MGKKVKMQSKQVEQIKELATKITIAANEVNISRGDELEVFAEAVALVILGMARTGGWTATETYGYASYVIMNFMEKGITADIDKIEEYINKKKNENRN